VSLNAAYGFASGVIAAAAGVAAVTVANHDLAIESLSPALVILAALVIATELVPLRVPMQHDDVRLSASTAFALSVLVLDGPAAAVLAFGAAALLRDLTQRLSPIKVAFNLANVVLATCAAGWALDAIGGIAGGAVAGLAMWGINNLLTHTVSALAMGLPLRRMLRDEAPSGMVMDLVMIAFSPVVITVAEHAWPSLFLLLIPLGALVHSAHELDHRRHATLHDTLTGLPNRVLLDRQIEQELARTRRRGESCAVLVLDLDRFKEVNDTLGHGHGDALLQRVAARLVTQLRTEDTVARLAGDEFGVLLSGPVDADDAMVVADRIRGALAEPIAIGGLRVVAAASIGIAVSELGDDGPGLLRRADVAMYRAKEQDVTWALYDEGSDPHTAERLALVADLRDGIERGELVLHFQPKVTPCRSRVDGTEALVRWQHPTRGLLGPGEFLPLAEQSDLMQPLTDWVLEEALRQVAEWRAVGVDVHVAVNLSAQTLRDDDLADTVAAALGRHDLPAQSLQLEVTESTLMRDPQRAAEILERLSTSGVRIAIDDFGTGWSSLLWLKRLPVQSIKVDRSFVGDMLESPSDDAIVESTIRLGQTLGLEVVAEGVETEETLERLREYGCHAVQGYLIARPQSAADLTPWLLAAGVAVPA
jgi:diguanylate cyclase (GGDEF)-like protein